MSGLPDLPGLKFSTRRNPDRPTRGTLQGAFAKHMIGKPLMPWQQHVADVAGELEYDDETGLMLPVYSTVVLTVQRQAGKSHFRFGAQAQRCTMERGLRSWYTAQSGQDARNAFLKFADSLDGTPLGSKVRTLRGMGNEVMHFPGGSQLRPYPPKEDSLHGEQADENDIDEAWSFTREHGRALVQASAPTKLTRPGSQTWIESAGGTAASTFLAELVASGRAGASEDYGSGRTAYFEFGIPDDADAEDMNVIVANHPAIGHTITRRALEAMRSEFVDDPAGWARAAGNRWTEVIGGGISEQAWNAIQYPDPIPDGNQPVGYGVARSPEGDQVVIVSAVQLDEYVVVEVLDVRSSWNAAQHVDAWAKSSALAVYPNGPSASIQRGLIDLGRDDLVKMSQWDAVAATSTLLDSLDQRGIRFRPHGDMDAAVKSAGLRTTGNGGKVWAPTADLPIAALEAATAALAALRPANQPDWRSKPIEGPLTVFA